MAEKSPILLLLLLFKLGGVLLLLWPFILLGNIMSLAGDQPNPPPPQPLMLVVYGFLWGSTLYPAIYLPGLLVAACFEALEMNRAALATAWVVVGYIGIIVALFVAWLVLGAWYGR